MTTAIVLAGGLGTRLRSTVADVPKPMAPIGGRPFLEYQMDYWLAQGVSRFILSVGYRADVITGHFGAEYRGIPVEYAVESSPLGTGGGLILALAQLSGDAPFLLLNGDTFFEVDLGVLRAFHLAHGASWTFSLFRTDEAERYMGVEVAMDGSIRSLRAGKGGVGALANGGVYFVEPTPLRNMAFKAGDKLSLEEELLPAFAIAGGKLFAAEFRGRFIDIGVPLDYLRAAEYVR